MTDAPLPRVRVVVYVRRPGRAWHVTVGEPVPGGVITGGVRCGQWIGFKDREATLAPAGGEPVCRSCVRLMEGT